MIFKKKWWLNIAIEIVPPGRLLEYTKLFSVNQVCKKPEARYQIAGRILCNLTILVHADKSSDFKVKRLSRARLLTCLHEHNANMNFQSKRYIKATRLLDNLEYVQFVIVITNDSHVHCTVKHAQHHDLQFFNWKMLSFMEFYGILLPTYVSCSFMLTNGKILYMYILRYLKRFGFLDLQRLLNSCQMYLTTKFVCENNLKDIF